jgi:hypothetical protein
MVLLLLPSLAMAIAPKSPDQAKNGPAIIHAPELNVQPTLTRYQHNSFDVLDRPGVPEFTGRYTAEWEIFWDERGNRPNLISGRGVPMLPGRGNNMKRAAPVSLSDVEAMVRGFVAENRALFGIDLDDFRLRSQGSGNFGKDNQLWFIELQQFYKGIPVEGAVLYFRINNGNLIQFGCDKIGKVTGVNTHRLVTPDEALSLAIEALGVDGKVAEVLTRADHKIFPALKTGESPGHRFQGNVGNGYRYLLLAETMFRMVGDDATYRALIDVNTRKVIDLKDTNLTADVRGGIYPTTYLDTEVTRDFQFVTTSGDVTALNGVYTRISDNCGSISCSDSADGSTDGVIDLGMSGGTDCTTPGYGGAGNTHAARSGHYHLTNINRIADSFHPSNSWLDSKLTAPHLQRLLERQLGQLLPLRRRLRQHR